MNTKKIVISLLIALLIASISTIGFCESVELGNFKGDTSGETAGRINTQANNIIGIVQIVAVAIAVIMLIWLAIKYISAAPSEKADIKKSALIYIVGAVLLFATTGILGIIRTFAGQLTAEEAETGASIVRVVEKA